MTNTKLAKRITSLLLSLALVMTYLPVSSAASPLAQSLITETAADPGTAHTWETMMGTDADGNRYAGRVWVDKSVYKNGDTVILNTKGEADSSFQAELNEDEAFQVVFSALGSTMTTKKTISSSGPLDVVLILDDSTSMDDRISGSTTRLEKLIEASNELLDNLSTTKDIRIGIVAYNQNSIQVLPFGVYTNGIELRVRGNKYTFDENNRTDKGGTIQAFDKSGTLLYNNTSGYARGTNLQAGVNLGMSMLENARDTENRTPVAIVLTDGAANTAALNTFYNIGNQTPRSIFSGSVPSGVAMATLLTAAYKKARVEDVYGTAPMIYGIGVDIDGDAAANAVINPGASVNGFNSSNSSSLITTAYRLYNQWLGGSTVRRNESYSGTHTFTFDHGYTNVTRQDIENNIHYVDTYYPVSSAELNDTFTQIYEELSSGVFNPISTSTSTQGGTGVDDTPLIYVDFIGQHMEIKKIQSVTLFGASYGVTKNENGTYTVNTATGTNPTTNESWNTAEDITISVTETEGVQKLEIRINQEILPIIMEQVLSETVGDVTTASITEIQNTPLRVFYTVGLDSDILLPGGTVDVSKLQGYPHIDDAAGTVSFYSNRFGVMNPDGSNGDAHVGFQPSDANRYYYHQTNQGIFTGILNKSGGAVTIPENEEYGIVWDDSKYDLKWMTYEEYLAAEDTDKVYTYVTYYRPTPSASDAPNAAESVTYLVYTDWGYLKESAAFYDAAKDSYLNNGAAIPQDQVAGAIAQYRQANPGAELYAVLGVGSLRTSRLHNMTVAKVQNPTDTAGNRYAPEYTHETANIHNGNSVVVWLGNNGKLTVSIDTGIALTKAVTAPIGNEDDTYALTVTLPAGVNVAPTVLDEDGNTVTATYENNILTVPVKAGQTVYIDGIPGGTECLIGEIIRGDYQKVEELSTATVIVPTVSQVVAGAPQYAPATVTNAPYSFGDLHITKEITSDHAVPENILEAEFGITVNVGQALAGKTFAVKDSTQPDGYEVTVDAGGNMVFTIKARQTIDILQLPAETVVTVTEAVPDPHFTVSYRTRDHSGETPDGDNTVVIPTRGSATAVVLNHYTPAPTSVDLDIAGTKNFTAEGSHDGSTFLYKVQQWNGTYWEDIPGKTGETPYGAGESGTKYFTIENVLEGITYTQVGNYSYQVLEVKGDVANVTYDRTLYTFDVTVTDADGQLVATVTDLTGTEITDGSYEVTFNNTYHTAPVSLDIQKIVNNYSGDDTVSAAGFEFRAIPADENREPLTDDGSGTFSVYSDAAGTARFTSVCTQAGTYYFLLSEVRKDAPGWTSSSAVYHITVTVTEENGDLTATISAEKHNSSNEREWAATDAADASRATVTFVNTYDPQNTSVDLDGAVKKVLTGKPLEADQFTFYVYKDGDRTKPILTGTNDLNGDVSFVDFEDVLTFSGVGTYAYDIVEHIPAGAVYEATSGKYVLHGMRYDPTIYDLVVEVTNDLTTGKLNASYYFEDSVTTTVTYYNHYEVTPTQYALGGVKILDGRAPRNGEFTFELYEGDTRIDTVTNKADGSFTFRPIPYDEAGTYTYTIREAAGNVAGVTYTGVDNPITVTVTVVDENGELKAAASLENAQIRFENLYRAKAAAVTFNGTKELVGGTLTDGAFTFALYRTDSSFDITKSNAQLLATDTNEGGSFGFTKALNAAGTYFFVVAEDASDPAESIVYDRSVHRFTVRVTDIGDGQLQAMVINVNNGETSATAASVSTAVSFTNATFDAVTQKEVFKAGNVTTQIDGKKVNAGDILTYFITYTNYTGAEVVADIMDVIPNHTTYVEGSASHGGSYAGTHINWILNVPRDETVTVSFDVKVAETDVIVANTAVVRDGVNTYHTNEVVNHTVEDIVKKDVFSPAEPTVSIDGKTVSQGDELLYSIRYTNTSSSPVDITITDTPSRYTTYVEGSADNGGVYQDGTIRWSIEDVPAWTTVAVTFKVTVNTGVGGKTVENKATVIDDSHSYDTNIVTNPVEDPKTPPTPQTGDTTQLSLWFTLLFISGGGILTTALQEKKKKEYELR